MDLSWCIICDRHSIEDNLYCSESCRMQDDMKQKSFQHQLHETTPPTSPLLDPFFFSFSYDRRASITITRNVPRYSLE